MAETLEQALSNMNIPTPNTWSLTLHPTKSVADAQWRVQKLFFGLRMWSDMRESVLRYTIVIESILDLVQVGERVSLINAFLQLLTSARGTERGRTAGSSGD